jgi:hypothetical protein
MKIPFDYHCISARAPSLREQQGAWRLASFVLSTGHDKTETSVSSKAHGQWLRRQLDQYQVLCPVFVLLDSSDMQSPPLKRAKPSRRSNSTARSGARKSTSRQKSENASVNTMSREISNSTVTHAVIVRERCACAALARATNTTAPSKLHSTGASCRDETPDTASSPPRKLHASAAPRLPEKPQATLAVHSLATPILDLSGADLSEHPLLRPLPSCSLSQPSTAAMQKLLSLHQPEPRKDTSQHGVMAHIARAVDSQPAPFDKAYFCGKVTAFCQKNVRFLVHILWCMFWL